MQVQTLDAVFIRAPRRSIHPVVADVAGWTRWWPGLQLRASDDGQTLAALWPPGWIRPPRRWTLQVTRVRPQLGIDLRYAGEVAGDAEFYYLDETAGTVVHYALRGTVPDRRWRAAVRDHRAGVRAGLDALKDRLELGRVPGAEPDAALLAEQQRAKAAFAALQRTEAAGDEEATA
jgi:hypothetical protein